MNKNRRRNKRYEVDYPVESQISYPVETLILKDLSIGGICFIQSGKPTQGEIINLALFLKHRRFNLEAKVIYFAQNDDKKFIVGAEFINPSEEFCGTFETEIADMVHYYRQQTLYKHKDISLHQISEEYLKPLSIDES